MQLRSSAGDAYGGAKPQFARLQLQMLSLRHCFSIRISRISAQPVRHVQRVFFFYRQSGVLVQDIRSVPVVAEIFQCSNRCSKARCSKKCNGYIGYL